MMKVWLLLQAVTAAISSAYCSDGSYSGVQLGSWGAPIPVYSSRNSQSSNKATDYDLPLTTSDRNQEDAISQQNPPQDTPKFENPQESFHGFSGDLSTDLSNLNENRTLEVPKTEYLLDEEYDKYLAERMLYFQKNNISDIILNQQYNDTSNETSVTGGRRCYDGKCSSCCGEPNPCDCVPIHPEMKDFQWSAGKHCLNLEANINLLFKEDNYWCRIKTIIKNAVEDALGNRCTLCNRKHCPHC